MLVFIIRRSLQSVVVLLAMSIIVFVGVYAIGNPIDILINPQADQIDRERAIAALGLDKPLWEQYLVFLKGALSGDLGRSFVHSTSALRLILEKMPATLELAVFAMLIAVLYTLSRLNNDSELVVMSAAGLSPRRLFRPFFALAAVVSILVLFIGAYLAPNLQRELVRQLTKVRADLVANVVRAGTFATIENGLTFHVREKHSDSQFSGVLIDDSRNGNERTTVIAEKGDVLQSKLGTFLVMTDGWVQRRRNVDRDPTMVQFERYAFDLSPYTVAARITYGLREKYLWELVRPDPNDQLLKTAGAQFRAEMHDRLVAPFYPFAFAVVAFAALANPMNRPRKHRTASITFIS